MKIVSQLVGLAGALVVVLAVFGRFHGPSTMTVLGHTFSAASVLLMGNTLLVLAVFLMLLNMQRQKPAA